MLKTRSMTTFWFVVAWQKYHLTIANNRRKLLTFFFRYSNDDFAVAVFCEFVMIMLPQWDKMCANKRHKKKNRKSRKVPKKKTREERERTRKKVYDWIDFTLATIIWIQITFGKSSIENNKYHLGCILRAFAYLFSSVFRCFFFLALSGSSFLCHFSPLSVFYFIILVAYVCAGIGFCSMTKGWSTFIFVQTFFRRRFNISKRVENHRQFSAILAGSRSIHIFNRNYIEITIILIRKYT